jgi:hypothetical protein
MEAPVRRPMPWRRRSAARTHPGRQTTRRAPPAVAALNTSKCVGRPPGCWSLCASTVYGGVASLTGAVNVRFNVSGCCPGGSCMQGHCHETCSGKESSETAAEAVTVNLHCPFGEVQALLRLRICCRRRCAGGGLCLHSPLGPHRQVLRLLHMSHKLLALSHPRPR